MKILLLVGLGSFIGGISRYLLTYFIQAKSSSLFPYGTLTVNLLGCLVIGIVFALSESKLLSFDWKLFLATGICGGFTTYSAFSMETFSLLRNGALSSAMVYVLATILIGFVATCMGFYLTRMVV